VSVPNNRAYCIITACRASVSVGFSACLRNLAAQKLGRAKQMEGGGRGSGGEKRKRLPANPMILKNAPLTLHS